MLSPPAKEPLDLRWKFAEGDTLYVTHTEESDSTATERGKVVDTASRTEVFTFKLEVVTTSEKGTAFKLTYGTSRSGHAAARNNIKLEDRKELDGQSFTFFLHPDYKVTKIRGNEDLWAKAASSQPEGTSKGLAADLFSTIPGKQLRVGAEWTAEMGHPMSGGYMELTARSTVDGVADGVVKLTATTDHAWDCRGAKGDGSFDELRGENGTRTTWFDQKTGRVTKVEGEYTTTGTLRPPWTSILVTHRIRQTIVVSDKPPKDE
jgi:hypothetical protein